MDHVRLLIGTPCHSDMKVQYVLSLVETVKELAQYGIDVELHVTGGSILHKSRNQTLAYFAKSSATHLLFVDSDISFVPLSVMRLLHFDKEFSAAACPLKSEKHPDWFAVQVKGALIIEPETGMIKVSGEGAGGVGTGFMMLKKSAVQKMMRSFPDTKMNFWGNNEKEKELNDYYFNLFDWGVDEQRRMITEDYLFCKRWLSIGGEIFIDPTQYMGHTGEKTFVRRFDEEVLSKLEVLNKYAKPHQQGAGGEG